MAVSEQTTLVSRPAASVFQNISGDHPEVSEMESLCMSCERNGTTRILPVKIPFFKEVIVSSFSCPHCGHSNTSTMEAEDIQEKAVEYQLQVKELKDLNRTVVLSEFAAVRIPELEFEAPYRGQTFGITTVEGVLCRVKDMLENYVKARRSSEEEEVTASLENFVRKVDLFLTVKAPFNLIIDDPSGNSFIENPYAPSIDHQLTKTLYERTAELDAICGLTAKDHEDIEDEVIVFPATCHSCRADCQTTMKNVRVPHFNEILIMSTVCDACGWRNNEAKPSGGIADEGIRLVLSISSEDDLNREVIKAATCSLRIPELDFDMLASDHSSRYTTVEGILRNIRTLVADNPFAHGDSSAAETVKKMDEFITKLDDILLAKCAASLILDDPAGNSYIQAVPSPEADRGLKVERYTRTEEQNLEIGILDMKTENYDEQGDSSHGNQI